jgi:acetyl esterase
MKLSTEVLQNIAFSEKMGFDKLDQLPPAETREKMKQFPKNPDPIPVGEVINYIIPEENIPVRIYIPKGAGPFPLISYFHGGGFVLMSIELVDDICREICVKSESVVMSVDYLLAPEHPYPEGPDSCIRATQWMIRNAGKYNGIGGKMAVGGDSAGGYMALYTAQKLTLQGIKIEAQFAAYPVTDHYTSHHPSWEENKMGFILSAQIMKWFWDNYLTDTSKINQASPLRTKNFSGLPPALIITANFDPLRDEGKAYAEKLKQANVETVYRNYENIHGFLGTGEMGLDAIQIICDFLIAQFKCKKESIRTEQRQAHS